MTLVPQYLYHDLYLDVRIEVFRQSVPLTGEVLAPDLALDGKRRKPDSVEAWLLRRRSQQVRMNRPHERRWLVGLVTPTWANQPTEVCRTNLLPYPRLHRGRLRNKRLFCRTKIQLVRIWQYAFSCDGPSKFHQEFVV